jgi:hypothetical protein
MEAVNGFDEMLDYGNDCHMQNIRDRVALLGGQVSKKKTIKKKKQTTCKNISDRVALLGGRVLKCLKKPKKINKKKETELHARTSETASPLADRY